MGLINLLKKIFLTAFCRGLTAAGTFGLNVVLARKLSLVDYGNLAVCLTAVLALAIFSRFGFETSLLRFGGAAWYRSDFKGYRRIVQTALLVVTCISALVWCWSSLGLWLVPSDWSVGELLPTMLGALPFLAISSIIASGFKAAHRPEAGALFEIGGASLLACLLVLLAASLDYEITAMLAARIFVGSAAAFCIVGFSFLMLLFFRHTHSDRPTHSGQSALVENGLVQEINPPSDDGESEATSQEPEAERLQNEPVTLKEYFLTSADFVVVAGAQFLGNWSGVFFLQFFQDESAVALFSAARRTSLLPLLLLSVVVAICSPKLAGLFQAAEMKDFRSLVHRSALVVCLVNVPVLLIMALGAPWGMQLFGSEYQSHWILLTILASGQLVGAVTGIATGVMGMVGEQQLLRKISIISAVIAVLLAAFLSASFGVIGAAIAGALYAAGQSAAVAIAVRHKIGYLPIPSKR